MQFPWRKAAFLKLFPYLLICLTVLSNGYAERQIVLFMYWLPSLLNKGFGVVLMLIPDPRPFLM